MLPPEEFYKTLPTKRSAAQVVFFNQKKELLIVKPNYRKGWLLTGGSIDDNESPRQAAQREVKEELSLEVKDLKLICVDYKKTHKYKPEGYFFIFFGGQLSEQQIKNIKLQTEELVEFQFVTAQQAQEKLAKGINDRLKNCLKAIDNNTTIYLENGQLT